ncbi:MAG: hypothetical protein KF788_06740 [Piscinibacter sp.]|nr:hypothetical protein [Piscinibacter sp.]
MSASNSAVAATRPDLLLRDRWGTLGALALLLAWDASGLDRPVSSWVGGHVGFPWRDAWLTRSLLHDGGRWLSALVLALLVADALWRTPDGGLSVGARWAAIGVEGHFLAVAEVVAGRARRRRYWRCRGPCGDDIRKPCCRRPA